MRASLCKLIHLSTDFGGLEKSMFWKTIPSPFLERRTFAYVALLRKKAVSVERLLCIKGARKRSQMITLCADRIALLFTSMFWRKQRSTNWCLGHILAMNMTNFKQPWGVTKWSYMGKWCMVGLVWTSSFGIRSLIRSLTYNTSTRVISLGVVFMEDFRSDPNEN